MGGTLIRKPLNRMYERIKTRNEQFLFGGLITWFSIRSVSALSLGHRCAAEWTARLLCGWTWKLSPDILLVVVSGPSERNNVFNNPAAISLTGAGASTPVKLYACLFKYALDHISCERSARFHVDQVNPGYLSGIKALGIPHSESCAVIVNQILHSAYQSSVAGLNCYNPTWCLPGSRIPNVGPPGWFN